MKENKELSGNIVPGVIKCDRGYRFSVWAPNAEVVYLTGSFNDWADPGLRMEALQNGVFSVVAEEADNGDEYKFIIETQDGRQLQRNDPRARKLTNSAGNSIIYDDHFQWQQSAFTPPPFNKQVIYELHIGTFNKPEDSHGTFDTAIDRLDELTELGVNMVEVMPVNEFAGDISWGYNPAYPFAVEEAYGGPDGLKRFIDAAHARGIGVILDVVYNHFGPTDLDIWQFDGWQENDKGGIYFYNDYRSSTPWGETRPDYGREEVRQYIIDNALMWINEFRADGLRMDMVPFMRCVSGADNGSDDIPEAYELIRSLNHYITREHEHKQTIAEDLHMNDYISNSLDDGGCGYTAQWDAGFVHPVRNVLKNSDENVNLDELEQAVLHQYGSNPFSRVVYTESHDEVANGSARLVEEIAPGNVDESWFARQKGILAAALTLTSPGIPMLFQGQSIKQYGWFEDTDDVDWERKQEFPDYHAAFCRLVGLRTSEAGLCGGITETIHRDDEHKVLGYRRATEDGQAVLVYVHLGYQEVDHYGFNGLPEQAHCLFAWEDGDTTEQLQLSPQGILLKPFSVYIFRA